MPVHVNTHRALTQSSKGQRKPKKKKFSLYKKYRLKYYIDAQRCKKKIEIASPFKEIYYAGKIISQ